jgi:predicted amidophosphoribosyltransferase
MTDRDYLWCALNLLLDGQEELDRLCPACRAQAERETCPVCGVPLDQCGQNDGFDWARFEALKGAKA